MDEMLAQVKRLSSARMPDGRTFREAFAYRGVSLWWFIENSIYTDLKRPRARKVFGVEIPVRASVPAIKAFLVAKMLARRAAASFAGPRRTAAGRKVIVSNSLWHWRKIWDPTTMRRKNGDAILDGVVRELVRAGFDVVGVDRDDGNLVDMKLAMSKFHAPGGIWKPIEAYSERSTLIDAIKYASSAEKMWNTFVTSRGAPALLKKLPKTFKLFFVYHVFQAVAYLEMAARAIAIENPALVLLADEHSDSGRALVAAARMAGVPTLAVQHGFHSKSNVMYFKGGRTSGRVRDFIDNGPAADKTAVFGPWIRDVLVDYFGYTPREVEVTGQPRYDVLANAGKIFDRKRFCSKFGVDCSKKIVLVITQPFTFDKRESFFKGVLEALGRVEGVTIVVKPHPVEKEQWHRRIATEQHVELTVLPKSSDTYEALYACDAMVTSSSTTALEAMIVGKPVVVADWLSDPWARPFVESGSVISVKNKDQLAEAVRKALYDRQTLRRLSPKVRKFVHEQTYKQDGRATERVVALAKRMAKRKV